jgi:hypothetical protein
MICPLALERWSHMGNIKRTKGGTILDLQRWIRSRVVRGPNDG